MRLILAFVSISFSLSLHAAEKPDLASKPRVRVEQPKRVKHKKTKITHGSLGTFDEVRTAAPKEPHQETVEWGGEVRYLLRTDMADSVSPRVYTHSLNLAYGFEYVPAKVSVVGILDAAYESMGERRSEIIVDDDRKELFVNDFTLAADKTYLAPWKSKVSLGLSNEFPTSPEAQREDYASVTTLSASWLVSPGIEKVGLKLTTEVHYIWNQYKYSPATGDLNKQGGWRGEAGASWSFWRGFYVHAAAGAQVARYLDGTSDLTYRNSVGAGHRWESVALFFFFSNGTYLDREDAGVWFVDEYRRMVTAGLSYSF